MLIKRKNTLYKDIFNPYEEDEEDLEVLMGIRRIKSRV